MKSLLLIMFLMIGCQVYTSKAPKKELYYSVEADGSNYDCERYESFSGVYHVYDCINWHNDSKASQIMNVTNVVVRESK